MSQTTEVMLKDSQWATIDGDPCRVISFTPSALIKEGKVVATDKSAPYASISFECKRFPGPVTGFVVHEMDFKHLWAAFKDRGVGQNEEVIIRWSKKSLKGYARLVAVFMPKLWVLICPKGAFEIMTDKDWMPELTGEARWNARMPLAQWKPEAME